MRRIICYLRTIKEWDTFLTALFKWGAIYIAHTHEEQKSYRKGNKRYYPLKCSTCGNISEAFEFINNSTNSLKGEDGKKQNSLHQQGRG